MALGHSNSIAICDMNGKIRYRQVVTNSEVKVPTSRLKGMYIHTILSDGKVTSTGKVIAK